MTGEGAPQPVPDRVGPVEKEPPIWPVNLIIYVGALHFLTIMYIRASGSSTYSMLGVVLVVIAIGLGIGIVVVTGFYRQWLFWRPQVDVPVTKLLIGAFASWIAVTVALSSATALAYNAGALGPVVRFPNDQLDPETPFVDIAFDPLALLDNTKDLLALRSVNALTFVGGTAMAEAESYYVWHLLDSVPGLRITSAYQWAEPKTFSGFWAGTMLLTYKLLIAAPLVRLILQLMKQRTASAPARG